MVEEELKGLVEVLHRPEDFFNNDGFTGNEGAEVVGKNERKGGGNFGGVTRDGARRPGGSGKHAGMVKVCGKRSDGMPTKSKMALYGVGDESKQKEMEQMRGKCKKEFILRWVVEVS